MDLPKVASAGSGLQSQSSPLHPEVPQHLSMPFWDAHISLGGRPLPGGAYTQNQLYSPAQRGSITQSLTHSICKRKMLKRNFTQNKTERNQTKVSRSCP